MGADHKKSFALVLRAGLFANSEKTVRLKKVWTAGLKKAILNAPNAVDAR
jgi:hypothetical protein